MRLAFSVALVLSLLPFTARAQDSQTLADIRQELSVLYVEVQRLRRELSTTGSATVQTGGASVIERLTVIEGEMQRLTSKTEELEFRINRIVEDGTNRIGDLEFRLVELEGGDVSTLGETSTLGGALAAAPASGGGTAAPAPSGAGTAPSAPVAGGTELAIGEEDDFKRAQTALAEGNYSSAAEQFATFNQNYPGGPLAPGADLGRGEALEALGDTREAARSYLASFSAAPTGPLAPQALYRLGRSLGALQQTTEACVTLSEVSVRFPSDPAAAEAQQEKLKLGCS
jgi:tol-pal system protein YbgF